MFYGLLAVFPAVTVLVSLYGWFASPPAISDQLALLAGILPQGALDILREQIGHLTAGSGAKLGFGLIFGLAVALWSANGGMKAIMDARNVVYDEEEKRSFIKLNLVSLAFTVAAIAALLLALGAVVSLPIALSYLGLQNVTDLLFRLALAAFANAHRPRLGGTLPLRAKQPGAAMAMDQRRQRLCRSHMAHQFGSIFLVSFQFCQL